MSKMLNIFSISEDYPKLDENRLTASFLFLLSECRDILLSKFLEKKLKIFDCEISKVDINFQPRKEGIAEVPDAEIRYSDELYILIEAKVGTNQLNRDQLENYIKHFLINDKAKSKILLCITQTEQTDNFDDIINKIKDHMNPTQNVQFKYLRWSEIADFVKESCLLTKENSISRMNKQITSGKNVNYKKRLCSLFLSYMGEKMYDKEYTNVDVDNELKSIPKDIAVVAEQPWYMYVAKKYHIWLPSSSIKNFTQFKYAKYVAYYETAKKDDYGKNENPKEIAYIARVLKYWPQLKASEAKEIEELKPLFSDPKAEEHFKDNKRYNFALTQEPVKLKRPIRKGPEKNMNKRGWYCDLITFINAETIPDLKKTGVDKIMH